MSTILIQLEKEISEDKLQRLFDTFLEEIEEQLDINLDDIAPTSLKDIFEVMVNKAEEF